MLPQGVVVGLLGWLLFRAFDVPAPTPLAVLLGALSLVPVVGIFVGGLPAVMLVAGFDSFGRAGLLLAILLIAQVAAGGAVPERDPPDPLHRPGDHRDRVAARVRHLRHRRRGRRAARSSVFAIALVEAAAEERGTVDLPPEEADPDPRPPGRPRPLTGGRWRSGRIVGVAADHPEAADVERLAGGLVDDQRADDVAVVAVDEHERRLAVGPHPVRAPAPHGGEHVPERPALVGEPVVVAGRVLLVGAP